MNHIAFIQFVEHAWYNHVNRKFARKCRRRLAQLEMRQVAYTR